MDEPESVGPEEEVEEASTEVEASFSACTYALFLSAALFRFLTFRRDLAVLDRDEDKVRSEPSTEDEAIWLDSLPA